MDKKELKELEKKLTDRQKIFCREYVIDWNATRAALKAGYSKKSVREIASKNLTKVDIQAYIDYIKDKYEEMCGITKMKQINEYAKIAYSSIAHHHNTWIELKEFETLTAEQKECIESIDSKTEIKHVYDHEKDSKEPIEVRYIKIKLYSKLAALERIDKLLGYNEAEKIDHTSKGEKISFTVLTKETADKLNNLDA